jgi:agmatinase
MMIPYNFLGLPDELSDYATAKVAVLPIPYDLTLSYQGGSRLGPQAIIDASRQVETYDDDFGLDPSEIGIATLPELEQIVSGPEAMQKAIYDTSRRILAEGKYAMTLGGEHSITPALVKAHIEKYSNLSVLQIDAHSDLRDTYQESKYSHACAMSRVAELAPFMGVGIRSFKGGENEIKYRKNIIKMSEFRQNPKIYEIILAGLTENVYITIDLDGLDPAVMPSVGTPEPGGLSWDETMELIRRVSLNKKIIGADVVELSPRPGLNYADFTAAKLAYKVIARSFFKEK